MQIDNLEDLREDGQEILQAIMVTQDCSFPEAVEHLTAWLISEILGVDVERHSLH